MMEQPGRHGADMVLVAALATGARVEDAARRAGVSRTTVYRRMCEPEFRQMVTDARNQMVERALGELSDASLEAAQTLRKLLHSRNDLVRLGACRTILEMGMKLRESVELAERVAALEGRV